MRRIFVVLVAMKLPAAIPEVSGQSVPVLNGEFERLGATSSVPGWLEGPAFDGDGGIWFSDLTIPIVDAVGPQLVFRYDLATGTLEEKLRNTGGANGLAFDADGLLITAHGVDRNLTRRPTDDLEDVAVLADSFEGNPLSDPNDIAIDDEGGIYFTDPSNNPAENSVFYLSPTNELRQVSTGIWFNNGIVLSPSGDTLYVASTGNQNIVAFDVDEDASLSNQRIFVSTLREDGRTFTPDGMTIDHFGNVYAADLAMTGGPESFGSFDPTRSGARVWVFNPLGEEVLRFDTPDNATANLLFGPDDMLYLTATDALYRVPVDFVSEPSLCSPGNALSGDLDGDGTVGFDDFLTLSSNFGTDVEAYADGDVNCDGTVGFDDFLALSANFGLATEVQVGASVPEPSASTLGCIAFASLALIRRRD